MGRLYSFIAVALVAGLLGSLAYFVLWGSTDGGSSRCDPAASDSGQAACVRGRAGGDGWGCCLFCRRFL